MEKDNKKMKAPLYKKEKARISKLVEIAKKHDPRIRKFEREEKEAREKRQKEIDEKKLLEKEKRENLANKIAGEKKAKEDAILAEAQAIEDEKKKKFEEKMNRKNLICSLVQQKVKLPQYSDQFLKLFLDKVQEDEYNEMKDILERDDLDLKAM
jgi:hypothetical protein